MVRILLSVLQFRVNARYVEANPPFTGIGERRRSMRSGSHSGACWRTQGLGRKECGCSGHGMFLACSWSDLCPTLPPTELDISDSGREGCAVSTLTITSEPKDWRGAVQASAWELDRMLGGSLRCWVAALHLDTMCNKPIFPSSTCLLSSVFSPNQAALSEPLIPPSCPACRSLPTHASGHPGGVLSYLSVAALSSWCPSSLGLDSKQVAIQEVRRLQRFGVTRGELERYKTALLRDRWEGKAGMG